MAEQIIDIRERIEKMRIKFENDQQNEINSTSNHNHNKSEELKSEINTSKKQNFSDDEEKNIHNKNNNLNSKKILDNNNNEFPSVQLSVKNPISSKFLVILMLLQVFSNIGIFMLLYKILE